MLTCSRARIKQSSEGLRQSQADVCPAGADSQAAIWGTGGILAHVTLLFVSQYNIYISASPNNHLSSSSSTNSVSSPIMCTYQVFSLIYTGCTARPKHVVTTRFYIKCTRPRNSSTYVHCSDEYAQRTNIVLGSSRTGGDCPVCLNPSLTVHIVSSSPLLFG